MPLYNQSKHETCRKKCQFTSVYLFQLLVREAGMINNAGLGISSWIRLQLSYSQQESNPAANIWNEASPELKPLQRNHREPLKGDML